MRSLSAQAIKGVGVGVGVGGGGNKKLGSITCGMDKANEVNRFSLYGYKRSDKHKTKLEAALIESEVQFTGEPWTFVCRKICSHSFPVLSVSRT